MQVHVALFGGPRVIVGQPTVDLAFDTFPVTLEELLEKLFAVYPRVRPYLLSASGALEMHVRVLINDKRPIPDVTLATQLHDGDKLTLLIAVAGGA
jgi:molybdopterin converting factor small subunit